MPYSVVLHLDKTTDDLVTAFWDELAKKDRSNFYYIYAKRRPHITLLSYWQTDLKRALETIEGYIHQAENLELLFETTGIFLTGPAKLSWLPTPSLALIRLHNQLFKRFQLFSSDLVIPFYQPERWVPHLGLAINLRDREILQFFVKTSLILPQKHTARITKISLEEHESSQTLNTF
ncbi:MAG: 2'-5' RNA ligase family protein [Anaerolineaceae bacterium]|nr:2'-5' RNA ligase family protein [Anaerolineaceae bacterium]